MYSSRYWPRSTLVLGSLTDVPGVESRKELKEAIEHGIDEAGTRSDAVERGSRFPALAGIVQEVEADLEIRKVLDKRNP